MTDFSKPALGQSLTEADFIADQRTFKTEAATHNFAGSTNIPQGAISLTNPGGASRAFKQRNASGQDVDVEIAASAFKANSFNTQRANTNITQFSDGLLFNFGAVQRIILSELGIVAFQINGVDIKSFLLNDGVREFTKIVTGRTYSVDRTQVDSATSFQSSVVSTTLRNAEQIDVLVQDKVLKIDGSTQEVIYGTSPGSRTTFRLAPLLILEGGGRVIAPGATDDGATNLQAGTAKFSSLNLTAQPRAYLGRSAQIQIIGGAAPIPQPYTGYSEAGSTGASISVNASSGEITVNTPGVYVVDQEFEFELFSGYELAHLNFSIVPLIGNTYLSVSCSIVDAFPAVQPCAQITKRLYLSAGSKLLAKFTGLQLGFGMSFKHRCTKFTVRLDVDQNY